MHPAVEKLVTKLKDEMREKLVRIETIAIESDFLANEVESLARRINFLDPPASDEANHE